MIKKINIALAIAFAAMFAMKGLKNLKEASAKRAAAQDRAAVQQEESQLAPHVCYGYWAGYTLENPISNRNGVLLDIVRAIFPKATFRHIHGEVKDFAKVLREDPHAVLVGFGSHPALKEFPSAPTPLMTCPLVVMTLRTNPWYYEGVESLNELRILADEAFLDYKVIRDLHERAGQNPERLRIMPSAVSKVVMAEMVGRDGGQGRGGCVRDGRPREREWRGCRQLGASALHTAFPQVQADRQRRDTPLRVRQ